MLTLEDIGKIAKIIENMTEDECQAAIERVQKLADMQERINKEYQTNPMVFSSCETVQ